MSCCPLPASKAPPTASAAGETAHFEVRVASAGQCFPVAAHETSPVLVFDL
jgi:hypothetical protein